MSNLIIFGLLIEIGIALGGFLLIKKYKKQTRQPPLSNKKIKNLKF
tara:strand:+ start:87 stop:224 length:138 start_codon:yes stop_codon:yes gene_type:complete